jgi:hypothetical protein
MVNLDVTAGNRAMWPNKTPPLTVFMDREIGLVVPPTVFGDWRFLPFRAGVFETVFFDPPHSKFGLKSVHMNPKGWSVPRVVEGRKIGGSWWGSLETGWFGVFFKAQREFARVGRRLCFKWNTTSHGLDKVLTVFEAWREVYRKRHRSKMKRGSPDTWWVTFVK